MSDFHIKITKDGKVVQSPWWGKITLETERDAECVLRAINGAYQLGRADVQDELRTLLGLPKMERWG